MSSAAFILKVQHIPISVGKGVKIEEQGTVIPFHSQYLRRIPTSAKLAVIPCTLKHGNGAYQSAEKIDLNA